MMTVPATSASERLEARLEELAELLQKREALRRVYRLLQTEWHQHPNCKAWLHALERSNAALSRRIDSNMRGLMLGV